MREEYRRHKKKHRYNRKLDLTRHDWKPIEISMCLAVVLSCKNKSDYLHSCYFLCNLLHRMPAETKIGGYRPMVGKHKEWVYDLCEKHVINRKLWGTVLGYYRKDRHVPFHSIIRGTRDEQPITFIEATRFINRWNDTVIEKCGLPHLVGILGRTDPQPVTDYLKKKNGEKLAVRDQTYVSRLELAERLMKTIIKTDNESSEVREMWMEMHGMLTGDEQ